MAASCWNAAYPEKLSIIVPVEENPYVAHRQSHGDG